MYHENMLCSSISVELSFSRMFQEHSDQSADATFLKNEPSMNLF